MKLKSKLITSFTTVLVITLGIFGIIIYYTIADNTRLNSDEIIQFKSQRMILKARDTLRSNVIEIIAGISPNIRQIMANRMPESNTIKLLRALTAKEPLINSIHIYNYPHKHLIPRLTSKTKTALLHELKNISPEKYGLWFIADQKLYLASLIPELDNNSSVVMEINQDALRTFLNSLFAINSSVLYLSQNNGLLIPPIYSGHGEHLQPPDFSTIRKSIISSQKGGEVGELGKSYLEAAKLFGADVTIFIPNKFYNSQLISLKNRIITVMLVVGWLSILTILVLAHTIADPIRKFTQLTKDIIAYNYSTKLEIKPSKDEIGELALNFEAMRLEINDLVTKDQLTHVHHRLFLMHVFELAVLKGLRLDKDLSCIMIDIDNFKDINDNHGYKAGDAVLLETGKVLLEHTRDCDTSARFSGDKFIMILPDTDIQTAKKIAEQIRKTMALRLINFEMQQIKCTLGLGIAGLDKFTAKTTTEIINHANFALHEAKGNGNQTLIYKQDKHTKN